MDNQLLPYHHFLFLVYLKVTPKERQLSERFSEDCEVIWLKYEPDLTNFQSLNNLTVFCFHTLFFVQVMLNAAPSFLNVFHRLVASIMQEGRQRGDGDTGKPLCAHLNLL